MAAPATSRSARRGRWPCRTGDGVPDVAGAAVAARTDVSCDAATMDRRRAIRWRRPSTASPLRVGRRRAPERAAPLPFTAGGCSGRPSMTARGIGASGAPEAVLAAVPRRCRRAQRRGAGDASAEPGAACSPWPYATWRCVARHLPRSSATWSCSACVGLEDPPRPGVAEALAACRRAGIRVAMVTGDHPRTAAAIAREVGLLAGRTASSSTGATCPPTTAALGALLDRDGVVVARVTPEDKLRIASALRARGHVVAMTGDGVNDGPALREADIGIAMGRQRHRRRPRGRRPRPARRPLRHHRRRRSSRAGRRSPTSAASSPTT